MSSSLCSSMTKLSVSYTHQANFGALPDLAVLQVLHHLPLVDLFRSVPLLNKRWNGLGREVLANKRTLTLLIGPIHSTAQVYNKMYDPFVPSETLKFTECTTQKMTMLIQCLPRISNLTFYNKCDITPVLIGSLAFALSNAQWQSQMRWLKIALNGIVVGPAADSSSSVESHCKALLTATAQMKALNKLSLISYNSGNRYLFKISSNPQLFLSIITGGVSECELTATDNSDSLIHALAQHYQQQSITDTANTNQLTKLIMYNFISQLDTIKRLSDVPQLTRTLTTLSMSISLSQALSGAADDLQVIGAFCKLCSLTIVRFVASSDDSLYNLTRLLSHLPSLKTVSLEIVNLNTFQEDDDKQTVARQWVSLSNVNNLRIWIYDTGGHAHHKLTRPAMRQALATIFSSLRFCSLLNCRCSSCGYDLRSYAHSAPANQAKTVDECRNTLIEGLRSIFPMIPLSNVIPL